MNVLFITLYDIQDIDNHGIYEDLLREFVKKKHQVYVVSPTERRNGKKTYIIKKRNCRILKVRTGNIQKTNMIEKGIATVMLETQFVDAIKKYYKMVKFDLVLYSTPPITIAKPVEFIKRRDGAKTYLLLKDIFPQNAVDIGMISKDGWKGILYKFFRRREKRLYALSDCIGCMSQANVDYVLEHNPEIEKSKVVICPNSIELRDMSIPNNNRVVMRKKYGIPVDKKVFVYGGNLGRPQGIDFLIKCLESQKNNREVYFFIIGSGTEYGKLEKYIATVGPQNVKLMNQLPREDYDCMVGSCDVGMIFLDHRFTIPNFPSRLLSYMQARMPVIAVTDPNTDIGQTIVEGNFGWWCESNHVENFKCAIEKVLKEDLNVFGNRSWDYMKLHYSVDLTYKIIMGPSDIPNK